MKAQILYASALLLALVGCASPAGDCTEAECAEDDSTTTGGPSADGGDAAGDGDPGDGDTGEECTDTSTVLCDALNFCWVHEPGWPARAHWVDPVDIQNGIDAGTLTPVDARIDAECYHLDGNPTHHPCVIDVGCTQLLGRPLTEVTLAASDCAPVGGPWRWVGESEDGQCWGLVDGVAVRLNPFGAFAEIRCLGTKCVGRPNGSEDAWVYAVSDDALDELDAQPQDTWTDGCAAGQAPDTFMPEHRCLWLFGEATSVCYAGDGEWWTQVDRCVDAPTSTAWRESLCDGAAGTIGEHPWDAVTCADVEGGSCMGRSGDDFMLVWPTCRFDAWDPIAP